MEVGEGGGARLVEAADDHVLAVGQFLQHPDRLLGHDGVLSVRGLLAEDESGVGDHLARQGQALGLAHRDAFLACLVLCERRNRVRSV